MTLYENICRINDKLIKNEFIENDEKQNIVNCFLDNISTKSDIDNFRKRNKNNENMYPFYYVPPYNNGQKYRIISGYKPKTEILSSNHYELEILRILSLWSKENETVKEMVKNTLLRLDKTCFGHYCSQGECLAAGVVILRFLNTVCPQKTKWIKELLEPMFSIFKDQKGMGMKNYFPFYYFCLVLSELPIEIVERNIYEKQEFLKRMLTRGCLIGPYENDTYNIIILYILRNLLSRIKEYEHIKSEEIYIKNNRCYCKL